MLRSLVASASFAKKSLSQQQTIFNSYCYCRSVTTVKCPSKVVEQNTCNNNNNNDTDDGVGSGSGTIRHRQLELDKVSIKHSLLS